MVNFVEINQAPPPSMLQYIGRVARPKLVPSNCLRYLQTSLKWERGIGLRIYMRYCRLLSSKGECVSFLTSFKMTYVIGTEEIRKFQEVL